MAPRIASESAETLIISSLTKDDLIKEKLSEEKEHDYVCVKHYASPCRLRLFGIGKWTLVHHNSLPFWLRDNDFIVEGYRPQLPKWNEVLFSLTYLHNETVNIYSHGLAGLWVLVTSAFTLFDFLPRQNAQTMDYFAWSLFLATALMCMSCSTFFHLTRCHSHQALVTGCRCDYAGITVLTSGSAMLGSYYYFKCQPAVQIFYWLAWAVAGVAMVVISFAPTFYTPNRRLLRAIVFTGFGCSTVVMLVHAIVVHGMDYLLQDVGFDFVLLEGAFYLLGGGLYAARIPERFFPGVFDIFGHSHQWHHIACVCGMASHWYAMTKAFTATNSMVC